MKRITKMMIALCGCFVAIMSSNIYAQAQEFDAENLDTTAKEELGARVEDGNKSQTIAFQNSRGSVGAFDCNGFFIGASGGAQRIDGKFFPFGTVSFAWEGIPTYRQGEKELPDGRIVKDWRYMLSMEIEFMFGRRRYTPEAETEGEYWTYGGMANLKYRIPGLDNATFYRLSVNVIAGVGVVYGKYDKVIDNIYVWNNGFGVIFQGMLEVRFRPAKNRAMAIFVRGGVTTEPWFALNQVATPVSPKFQGGFQFPIHANHRTVYLE